MSFPLAYLVVADKAAPTTMDALVLSRLTGLGYIVTYVSDEDAAPSMVGVGLVVIAESIVTATIGIKYKNVAVPVVILDSGPLTAMDFASAVSLTGAVTTVTVELAHLAAGGATGAITVFSAGNPVRYGTGLGPGAQAYLSAGGVSTQAAGLAYDVGSLMNNAHVAEAKRVFLGWLYDALSGVQTAASWSLFDAAVTWATATRASMPAPSPRLVIEYLTNDGTTFGPLAVDGVIHDALSVGWSWYSRFPANAYFTLRQDSPNNARLVPLLTHIRITYVNDATGYSAVVFTGRLGDPSSTGADVVWTAWNYLAELSLSRSAYRTLYPQKLVGTEIVAPEWALARTATFALLNFVATGTIQDPLGNDGVTPIKTDNRFGVIDVPRLLLMFDLSEIGRANTANNVTFEITRTPPFTFNFWKNKGTRYTAQRLTFPGSCSDYQFNPGFAALRNDLATVGVSVTGGAVEIIRTDEVNAALYGRRQDVFTIKTLAGAVGAGTESDAQISVTARAVKEATSLQKSLSLNLRAGQFEPFNGWDIEDTVPVQIKRGRDSIDTDYRIVGMRAVQNDRGYHPTILVQLPTS